MGARRAGVSAAYLSVGGAVHMLGTIVGFAILSRLMTRSLYGQFQQVWLVVSIVGAVTVLGLPHSMQYFAPLLPLQSQRRRFFVRTMVMLELAALGGGFAIWLFADPLSRVFTGTADLAPLLRSCWPMVLFFAFGAQSARFFTGTENPMLAAGSAAACGVAFALSLGGAAFFTKSVENLALSNAVGTGVVFAVSVVIGYMTIGSLGDREGLAGAPPSAGIWSQLRFALPLTGGIVAATAGRLLSRTLVSHYYAAEEYAVYANGAVELPLGLILGGAVAGVLQARLARACAAREMVRAVSLVHLTVGSTSLLIYPVAIFVTLFARDCMVALFGAKYAASGWVFMVFSLSMILRTYEPYSVINATGKTRVTFLMTILWLGGSLCGCWFGILLFGPIGAAAGTVLALTAVHVCYMFVVAWAIGSSVRRVLPWAQMGRTMAASVLAVASAAWTFLIPMHPIVRLLVGAAVAGTVYVLLVHKLGALQPQHRVFLREALARFRSKKPQPPADLSEE